MKYRGSVFFLLFSIACQSSHSQQCNCSTQLNYAIQKVEENYAGFADKVTNLTQQKYKEHTQVFKEKATGEKDTDSCLKLLKEWTKFFRDGHLQLGKPNPANTGAGKPVLSIGEQFYFKRLDEQTNLIRIASFNHLYKKIIDSIIGANYSIITSTKYLLIDIRGNGGGSDVSYEKLLPFIYTGPISVIGNAKLSTPDNIAKYEMIVNDLNFPEASRENAMKTVAKLKAAPGKFVEGSNDTLRLKEIVPYPAVVGILVDKKCASTAEQFLLAAKQSRKAVLFGENSMGVLDYANMHMIDFPCYGWKLGYPTSRSLRLPQAPVDIIGIAPDIRINSNENDWVKIASDHLQRMPKRQ